jgi:hypothetical protein
LRAVVARDKHGALDVTADEVAPGASERDRIDRCAVSGPRRGCYGPAIDCDEPTIWLEARDYAAFVADGRSMSTIQARSLVPGVCVTPTRMLAVRVDRDQPRLAALHAAGDDRP